MNCSDPTPVHEFDPDKANLEFEYLMAQVKSSPLPQADGDPGDENDYRDSASTAPMTTFLTKEY